MEYWVYISIFLTATIPVLQDSVFNLLILLIFPRFFNGRFWEYNAYFRTFAIVPYTG